MSEINFIAIKRQGHTFMFTYTDEMHDEVCQAACDMMNDEELPEFGIEQAMSVISRAHCRRMEKRIKNGVFNARAITEE